MLLEMPLSGLQTQLAIPRIESLPFGLAGAVEHHVARITKQGTAMGTLFGGLIITSRLLRKLRN